MIRVGVLGAGNHSWHNHGPALNRAEKHHPELVTCAAVCDLDRDRAINYANRFGFDQVYTDIDAMLAEAGIDAIIAITPVDRTRTIAGDLLAADIPVLLEKPPGRTVADAQALRSIANHHETPHMVSMNRRYNPALTRATETMAAHADHPPEIARATMIRVDRHEPRFLQNTGIHLTDAVGALIGPPKTVETTRWRDGSDGHVCTATSHHQEATANLLFASSAGEPVEEFELFGNGVSARINTHATACEVIIEGDSILTWQASDEMPRFVRNGTYHETIAFVEAAAGKRDFHPTLSDVLPAYALAAALEADRSGPISMGEG